MMENIAKLEKKIKIESNSEQLPKVVKITKRSQIAERINIIKNLIRDSAERSLIKSGDNWNEQPWGESPWGQTSWGNSPQ